MLVIGLTGGIATGKSTVSATLRGLGAVVLSADQMAHEAYKPGTEAWRDIVALWGEDLLDPATREVDRKKLGAIVFSDQDALRQLNSIVWPRTYAIMARVLDDYRKQGAPVVVLEGAVLIEANWTPLVDEVWVTVASEEEALDRLQKRNGFTREQALARIRSQISTEERLKHAHAVIDTNCPLDEVKRRVRQTWDQRIAPKINDKAGTRE